MRNVELELAEQYVLYTRKHCFLTGKAGTGKTTFLRKLVQITKKSHIIVAPTGVAAVNAGGVTIHSMFGLPLTCFVPNDDPVDPLIATNRHRLLSDHLRLRREKIDVLRELELLIIDEVSMVRCDVLDAVDLVLRSVRSNPQPFGGLQVLLIGDVHQLPPVAREREWSILERYYRSPFMFDALVWPHLDAVRIELQAVYRQSDARFLELLNNIRHRTPSEEDLRLLRERYHPDLMPKEPGYVLLSTHNHRADSVNAAHLAGLPGRVHAFEAEITGQFPEGSYPCDPSVQLKVGAQVMFIRNDTEGGAYYNGKLATVKSIEGTEIMVTFRESRQEYMLHRETWENIGYRIDEQSGNLVPEALGTFCQYPLRLAWAITIHKSQGLTFDKLIIDAGSSFAPGQVYVALSRCRTLEGILLHSLIGPGALREDRKIDTFSAGHHRAGQLQARLPAARVEYASYVLTRLFNFAGLSARLDDWRELIASTTLPDRPAATAFHERIRAQVSEIEAVAEKFRRQLQRLLEAFRNDPSTLSLLKERCRKAIEYFTEQIAMQLAAPLRGHINRLAYRKKVKRYLEVVQLIETDCWNRIERLYGAKFFDEQLHTEAPRHVRQEDTEVVTSATSGSQEKGGTFRDTLNLHRQGKTVSEIATIRGMSLSTIKQHLARWIGDGEISVYDVLPAATIDTVLAFMRENAGATVKSIRTGTGDQFDYNDIRMIVAHGTRQATSEMAGKVEDR